MNKYIKNFIKYSVARLGIEDEQLVASPMLVNENTALRYSTSLSNFLATIFLEQQENTSTLHYINNILDIDNTLGYTNSQDKLNKSIMNFYKEIAKPLVDEFAKLKKGDIKTLVTLIALYENNPMDGHLIAGVFKYENQVINLYLADTIGSGIDATKKIMEQIISNYDDSVEFNVYPFPALTNIKNDIDASNDCGLYAVELAKIMSTELSYDKMEEKMQLLPTTKEIKIEHFKEILSYLKENESLGIEILNERFKEFKSKVNIDNNPLVYNHIIDPNAAIEDIHAAVKEVEQIISIIGLGADNGVL